MAVQSGSISSQPQAGTLTGAELMPLDQDVGSPVAATALVVGQGYRIVSIGNTNWQSVGAGASAAVGTVFSCEAVGTGTGTAQRVDCRRVTAQALAALAGVAAAILAHSQAEDPHPDYTTAQELSNALQGYQPRDEDLTSLAAVANQTAFGRAFLALVDQATARDYIGLGPDDSATLTGLTLSGLAILPHIHGNLAGPVNAHVKNLSGGALAAGTPLRIVGTVGDTTTLQVVAASASSAGTMPALFVLSEPPGAPLFVPSGGGLLTATRPAANAQQVATVGRVHATTGSVHVLPWPVLGTAAAAAIGDFATAAQGLLAGTAVQPGELAAYALSSDSRFTDAREWSAATVEQAEAEARTATTRRAWTAERVGQAIAAWWTATTSTVGRAVATAADQAAARTAIDAAGTALASSSADGLAPATGVASGKYLKDDLTWATVSAGPPANSSTQVIFSDGTAFAGDVNFTFNSTTNALSVDRIYTLSAGLMLGSATAGPTLTASSNNANASVTLSSNGNGLAAGGPVILEGSSSVAGGDILRVNRKGDASGAALRILNGNEANFGGSLSCSTSFTAGNFQFTYTPNSYLSLGSNIQLVFSASSNSSVSRDVGIQRVAAGVIKLTDASTGGGILELPQVAAGGTPTSNSARIYARDVGGTAEIFVRDEAGNETQISPHNSNAPQALRDSPFDEIGYTANYYTAIITYTNKQRQMQGRGDAQLVETFEEYSIRTGELLIQLDWAAEQAILVAARNQEREVWTQQKAEWEARPENDGNPFPTEQPPVITPKPQPSWLTEQLAGRAAYLSSRPIGANRPDFDGMATALRTENGFKTAFLEAFMGDPMAAGSLTSRFDDFRRSGDFSWFLQSILLVLHALPPEQATEIGTEFLAVAVRCHMPQAFLQALQAAFSAD
jgi:hypothetical protein